MIEVRPLSTIAMIKDEIEVSRSTERDLYEYMDVFSYTESSLKGKTILNVGSGRDQSFSRTAAKYGARVINLDGRCFNNGYKAKGDMVIAFVQYLPFKENSFDETIGLFIIDWVKTERKQALLEMIRVTKPNGKIKIHPVFEELGDPKALKALKRKSIIEFLTTKKRDIDPHVTLTINKNPTYSKDDWTDVVETISLLPQDLAEVYQML